ncbi:MAG TPA: tetratricopeptide repeat protein, partial [Nannocystis sp.]
MKSDLFNPSDSHGPHRFHSDELESLVALAQAQPLPRLRTDADRLHAGFLAARQARTRRLSLVGGVALAAGLAGLMVVRADLGADHATSPIGHVAQDMSPEPASSAVVEAPRLATGVRVAARGEATPPTVRGPWEVELAPGDYEAEVEPHPGPEVLRARAAGGTVELHHGRVEIAVAASEAHATLRDGVATWVAPDGKRSELKTAAAAAKPTVEPADAGTDVSDVRALARRAEALLTAGQRDRAIAVLTQITRVHPHEPAARAALLDLAPLLKAAGRVDEARCAYRLYLERYPGKAQLADDV